MTPHFRPDIDPPRRQWVQMRVEGVYLRVCLVYSNPQAVDDYPGGFELVDFHAPGRPDIDWKWIDRNMRAICANLPFGA
jgi:hypothetical protein